MRAAAVLTTQGIAWHLAQPRTDPNCSVIYVGTLLGSGLVGLNGKEG
jgi:hypothetical protein